MAVSCGVLLELSGAFLSQELQTINKRFATRPWLAWNAKSLQRLNPITLYKYHEQHEIPRRWWAWDYTLSWLIEENHPRVKHNVVIFNHLLEDEPPAEAIESHPWMRPLLHSPMSRAAMADVISFIAKAGAKVIVLDYEFAQYSPDDAKLASAISRANSGELSGKSVTVLLARTINRRSYSNVMQLQVPSSPESVLEQLQKSEPNADVKEKYTGITGVFMDEDQVLRRIACRLPGQMGEIHESIVLKALRAAGETVPGDVPSMMDINFVGPPQAENNFKIRPMSYLLDPEKQPGLAQPYQPGGDVSLQNAIVFVGDGVEDVFSTPTTNLGVNTMSGTEVLANAFETIGDKRWLTRIYGFPGLVYIVATCVLSALFTVAWKRRNSVERTSLEDARRDRIRRILSDFTCFLTTVSLTYAIACLLFSYSNIIVPVMSPLIALTMAALATAVWEREQERIASLRSSLRAAEERLRLQTEVHRAEMEKQEAIAQARELELDQDRRREFVRRINHDLRAPVSVLSWTISRLKKDGLNSKNAAEKVDRLANTSDRMFALINELVKSYDADNAKKEVELHECNLAKVISDTYKMQISLAEQRQSRLEIAHCPEEAYALVNQLQLSRCVDNLIRNALLHNNAGITVKLSLESGGANHKVVVTDNGAGIPPEHIDKIFDSGYSADAGDKDAHHEGLGLSIVKTFVESMKGTITVYETPGGGATFEISLPNSQYSSETMRRETTTKTENQKKTETPTETHIATRTDAAAKSETTTKRDSETATKLETSAKAEVTTNVETAEIAGQTTKAESAAQIGTDNEPSSKSATDQNSENTRNYSEPMASRHTDEPTADTAMPERIRT